MSDIESQATLNDRAVARRGFLLATLGVVLTGCAKSQKIGDGVPSPAWDAGGDRGLGADPYAVPAPDASPYTPRVVAGLMSRSDWARGAPVPKLMSVMQPVKYLTIHHDGMEPFYGDDERSAAARLEAIRRVHRSRGWGDIGYHFAIDRAGVVWEARSLQYQGAHVKNHNEGNLGIVVLGNFDQQRPTAAQVETVRRYVGGLMRRYRVPTDRLRTHMEWAATACPGGHLQSYMVSLRSGTTLLQA